METTFQRTFASFAVRNFRLYFFGQGVSLCGTWMQTIALSWLVLQLTHSGTQLGLVVAAQFLPMLLLGVWGGVIADRFNKRHIFIETVGDDAAPNTQQQHWQKLGGHHQPQLGTG